MIIDNSDKSWNFYGDNDPYYGVCTQQKYRKDKLTKKEKENFFQTGEIHLKSVLNAIISHVDSSFKPKHALDFGCGVGRITIPLARMCKSVTGIDISPSMLKEANRNAKQQNISNVTYLMTDDKLTNVTSKFDFIHSHLVFQHIQKKRGEVIINSLLNKLEEDGVGAIHIIFARRGPFVTQLDWLKKYLPLINPILNKTVLKLPSNYPPIQMNTYNLSNILIMLYNNNCKNIFINYSNYSFSNIKSYGIMLFFQKIRN